VSRIVSSLAPESSLNIEVINKPRTQASTLVTARLVRHADIVGPLLIRSARLYFGSETR
jgi:hypothetical protein